MFRCPSPVWRGATEPDQDLLLGLRLSQAGETGLPGNCICHRLSWGWSLRAEPVCVCSVTERRDNYSSHEPGCTSPMSSHTLTLFFFFFLLCRSAPTLSSPLTAGEASCAPGQDTSSGGEWLRVLQAVRALSNEAEEAKASAVPPYPTPLLFKET